MFAGLGVIVDRESGAQRELLAAPIPRPLLVLGNLVVALAIDRAPGRRADRVSRWRAGSTSTSPAAGSRSGSSPSRVALRGRHVRRRRDARRPRPARRRSTSAACPRSRSCPWFLAGSLFPISALPPGSAWVAKAPAAHPRAGARCATACSTTAAACTNIWGMSDPTVDGRAQPGRRRARSPRALTAVSIRVFTRSALR